MKFAELVTRNPDKISFVWLFCLIIFRMGYIQQMPDGGCNWISVCRKACRNGVIGENYLTVSHMHRPSRGTLMSHIQSSPFMRICEELLRLNLTYKWLKGDFGTIDDFTITRETVEEIYSEIMGFPIVNRDYIIDKIIVGKELKFWDHVQFGESRTKPKFKFP